MTSRDTDLTFFTNYHNQTLLDRFKATLADTRLFDVLVGYFHSSGFYQLYDSIESIEKTRILVGLGVDEESYRAIDAFRSQAVFDFESHKNAKAAFQNNLINEIECSEEFDDKLELGLKKFITAQLLQQIKGRMLVICPPVLQGYWEESLHDFRVPARVESLGKLDRVIRFGLDRFDYIVVDEAHRFRNEATRSYADLLDICRGKKIILATATPVQ